MPDFSGKAVLVTGAGGRDGIGRAIALRFARDGADVALSDLAPVDEGDWRGIESVAEEIVGLGGRAATIYGDIAKQSDVTAMVDAVVDELGRIDILIANAAAATGADRVPVTDLPEDALDLTLDVNVRGTFFCCQAVGRHLKARKSPGRIILMSSVLGKRGLANQAAYSSSKFAVIGLTQCLAHELGPHGITVNAVCPGTIANGRIWQVADATRQENQSAQARFDEMVETAIAQTALKRIGHPDDVANLTAFLCSADADYITGQSISVCGGKIMH